MQRYFAEVSYKGTDFSGWQKQPTGLTVQQLIEEVFHMMMRVPIPIVGCGRTDTGVHASQYFFHFDLQNDLIDIPKTCFQLNSILPNTVAIKRIFPVSENAHARFDAVRRSYTYKMHFQKDVFIKELSYKYNQSKVPNFELVEKAAGIIMSHQAFYPFCKSNSDVETYKCEMFRSEWIRIDEEHWEYHISANRFLRGMVRLIVGACLNAGVEKISLSDITEALENQKRLEYAWSVPAEGLYLCDVKYPYVDKD